ncbi:MAG: SDR family NAD(P)-dependent oxidoreductase, partial [Pseudomonadota bacterium]|nr:SDR family NAD(P)-dependent oxidoreductase [Pseudomonadota bacterium]
MVATSRTPEGKKPPAGVELIAFDQAQTAIATATHVLETAAPDQHGDPALARHASALESAPLLRWAGMLSTTGVYGDRGGAWVDETTPPAPTGPRGAKRLEAERQWSAALKRCAVDLFRVAGIYGPGRSPFAEIRAGRGRRVDKPGHRFGRIHRDDIATAVLAAMG